jgi:hypothetical protein
MTRTPEFDDLIDEGVSTEERERLRRVHELLVQAGPPPELTPEIESGPTLSMTLGRRPVRVQRRVLLLAAAIVVLGLAFFGGYLAGNGGGHGLSSGVVLKLAGTPAAPNALASLRIEPRDPAGNWPMQLSVTGLPKLPAHGYYEVYLVRNGKPYAQCGVFVVAGASHGTTVSLNAPYRLKTGDTWVVTQRMPGQKDPGVIVMRPTA